MGRLGQQRALVSRGWRALAALQCTPPADLPTPPDLTADGALTDTSGRIYVCTDSGVQMLTPDAGRYRSQVFTVRDGMVNNECNRNAQFVDTQDRFWTGTLGGLIVHAPKQQKPDRADISKIARPLPICGCSRCCFRAAPA